MTSFAIGEVAVLRGLVRQPELNDHDCVIESAPHSGHYAIQVPGHPQWKFVHRKNLRKKRPPKFDAAAGRQAMLDCIERAKRPIEVAA
jgi:hypothetical protein